MEGLREADFDSPPGDHLGDYTEGHGDPYPATQEAWARSTEVMPGGTHERPGEVMADFDRFATQPMRYARPVRIAGCDVWAPLQWLLADGASAFQLIEGDPNRRAITIWNHSTGDVYIAPTPTRQIGHGSLIIPGGGTFTRRLEVTGAVWLFTLAGYVAGAAAVQVSALVERYG